MLRLPCIDNGARLLPILRVFRTDEERRPAERHRTRKQMAGDALLDLLRV